VQRSLAAPVDRGITADSAPSSTAPLCRRQRAHRPVHQVPGRFCPSPQGARQRFRGAPLRPLHPCSRLVLLDDIGRDTAAVLDLDALPLGPLADLGGVDGAAAAPAAGRAPGRAAGPPGVREVLPQSLPQLVAVRSISYSVPSRPKRTGPAASPPSRSSMSSV
jgi:hypothetical protein